LHLNLHARLVAVLHRGQVFFGTRFVGRKHAALHAAHQHIKAILSRRAKQCFGRKLDVFVRLTLQLKQVAIASSI
jgi:hypothetical protein